MSIYEQVGNDFRKAIRDGVPAENVIASDLQEGLYVNLCLLHYVPYDSLNSLLATG
jgi:hypothetical protein